MNPQAQPRGVPVFPGVSIGRKTITPCGMGAARLTYWVQFRDYKRKGVNYVLL